jgi:hypothetical protein
MSYLEVTFGWICGVLVGLGIALFQHDFYLEYLLKENLIDIEKLIQKKYKVK